jgi:uncharacterized protein DUF6959
VTDEKARVLAGGGNVAVTWLNGRKFPGIHVQGDTFAALQRQFADAAARLHDAPADAESLADLDYAVEEMAEMLRFYDATLEEHDIRSPHRGLV